METEEFQALHFNNIYYPFASRMEWELASWLSQGLLLQKAIDHFLHLEYVSSLAASDYDKTRFYMQVTACLLSFKSAKDLRSRMESLPAGPQWKSAEIKLDGYNTESELTLYWRDGLEVIKHLYSNPIFAQSIAMSPYRMYEDDNVRIYREFMSADEAWRIQVRRSWTPKHIYSY
jgi:hypothetical protein